VKIHREAVYREIAAEIRDQIRKGELKPGQLVESQHEMARRRRVSPSTAQRALAQLEQEGFVKSYQHQGTYVTGAKPQFPVPPYMRVVNDIAHDIETGLLKPGDMLLTEAKLAEFYHYSKTLISRAFGVLQEKDLVRVEPGIGTFVIDAAAPHDTRPKHVIAREGLTCDLIAGVFPVGGRLPNRAELAARYGAGTKAITRVLHAFRDQGIVHMYSHQPVTVLRKPDQEATRPANGSPLPSSLPLPSPKEFRVLNAVAQSLDTGAAAHSGVLLDGQVATSRPQERHEQQ